MDTDSSRNESRSEAEDTLPDRVRFGLDAVKWAAFQEALVAPPQPTPRLARLLREPGIFDHPGPG